MREDSRNGIAARLRVLRRELEDALGDAWPQGMAREVVLLADVGGALGLGDRLIADMLGAPAWELAAALLAERVSATPAGKEV